MSLESGNYISDLVPSNPTSNDPKSQGDDHLRLIKKAVQQTFPDADGKVRISPDQLILGNSATLAQNLSIKTNLDGTFTVEREDGVDLLTFDARGQVKANSAPRTVLANVALSANQAAAGGTSTRIIYNQVNWDTENGYSPGTGGYFVKQDGLYMVAASTRVLAGASGGEWSGGGTVLGGAGALNGGTSVVLTLVAGSTHFINTFLFVYAPYNTELGVQFYSEFANTIVGNVNHTLMAITRLG